MAEVLKKKKVGKTVGRRDREREGGAEEYVYEPIYEEIEAPKFVDFVAPDCYDPDDDRYWFCSRVGCDQKHEEEIDSETIWKNFVLKVMAARSPNVRLHKALSRKPPFVAARCPQSAPAKPSRLRASRLAVLSSSVSRKIAFEKEGTESARQKQKTPSNKGRAQVSNQHLFKSVGNSKSKTNPVKSNKLAAKSLAFPSPRKIKRIITTPELKSSIRNICEGMKKLELGGTPRKNILGYEKSSSSAGSKKRPAGRAVKSRVYDSFHPQKPKGNADAEYSGGLKRNQMIRNELKGRSDSGESSDMDVDGKSCRGSVETFDGAGTEEKDDSNPTRLDSEENQKDGFIRNEVSPSLVEKGEGNKNEAFDTDDKENAAAPDRNREQKDESNFDSIKKPGVHQKTQKVGQIRPRTLKENAPILKQTKPKPTNPKPFRLRTDERGILKEANLERKLQIAPKETDDASNTLSAILPKSRVVASKALARGNYNEKKIATMPKDQAVVKDNTSSRKELPRKTDKSRSGEGPAQKMHRKPVFSLQLRRSKDNTKRNRSVLAKQLEKPRRADNGKKEPENTGGGKGGWAPSATKADYPSGEPRSSSRVRKTPTIPKEPHFHEIHVPKSCTRKVNA